MYGDLGILRTSLTHEPESATRQFGGPESSNICQECAAAIERELPRCINAGHCPEGRNLPRRNSSLIRPTFSGGV